MPTYLSLMAAVKKADAMPFYYFYGVETYLVDVAVKALKRLCLGDGPEDFNYDVFYFGEKVLQDVLDVAGTLPMFSPKRLVVYKNIGDLKLADQELLNKYVAQDIDTTCLVFIGKKPDTRKKIFKQLKQHLIEFSSPKFNEAYQWMDQIADNYGKKLEQAAKSLLLEKVGNSLTHLDLEIQKAAHTMPENESNMTRAVLEATISKHRLESVFDLAKYIGKKDRIQSLYFLAQLLDQGENEIAILALISRHIRILNLVKEGQADGLTGGQLASRAGIPPFYVKDYLEQARLWDFAHLDQTHKALVLTDKALKSSPISSSIWLENFVLKVCD